jgi:CheY-like chemotaxis protein
MPFRYRILFVDDEASLRNTAKAILESRGYEVLCAEDGFDGLGSLTESLPDLIISDLQMPNMNGFEFLSVIRQRFPQIPVIVISGEFSGIDVPHSVLADAFFEKSQYTPDQLIAKIAKLLIKAPLRSYAGKPKTAVWIPHGENARVAVTCPNCLRTFSIDKPLANGSHSVACESCSFNVAFLLP